MPSCESVAVGTCGCYYAADGALQRSCMAPTVVGHAAVLIRAINYWT
jgi:hypothetical protein